MDTTKLDPGPGIVSRCVLLTWIIYGACIRYSLGGASDETSTVFKTNRHKEKENNFISSSIIFSCKIDLATFIAQ